MAQAEKPVEFIGGDEDWEVVKQESGEQIVFTNVGDSFTGRYKGMTVIEFEDAKTGPKSFNQYLFEGMDGKSYATNGSYQLDEELPKVPEGSFVRITLMALIQTDQPSPLKDFKIEVKPAS